MEEEELEGLKEEFPDYWENIEQTIIGEEMIEEEYKPDKEIQSSSNEIFKAINLLRETEDIQDELINKCWEKFNILYPLFSKLQDHESLILADYERNLFFKDLVTILNSDINSL